MPLRLSEIQEAVRGEKLDGWLFFDHHRRDPIAYRILGLDAQAAPTRRWYYLIPAEGEPRGLVHRIEPEILAKLPGEKVRYASWEEQAKGLARLLEGLRSVAMQYSPNCAVPYVSLVDAGTVELVRGLGVDVRSSANLVQFFEARWSQEQLESHLGAARLVDEIRRRAFRRIGEGLRVGEAVTEYSIKRFILDEFSRCGLVTDHGPIVAVNANASNPHYEPTESVCQPIRPGDWVLIDLWAKRSEPDAVYYDITWTGYCGSEVPLEIGRVFSIVREARDAAIGRVQKSVSQGQVLHGYEVDDAAREVIRLHGYGEYFIHRTGHSIGREVHGTGANMDNLETHDDRRVIAGTGFSIEPGIYLERFGIRSEVNVYVGERSAMVTGEIQDKPVLIA